MTYHMVMKQVTMAKAKAELSALLDRVEAGETVAITRRHRVVAEVRPAGSRRRLKPRPFGLCRGEFRTPDDFDAPLPADVLAAFDGRA
jgi:prevent-host-death family protein